LQFEGVAFSGKATNIRTSKTWEEGGRRGEETRRDKEAEKLDMWYTSRKSGEITPRALRL
jgi:hypothetical protein